MSELTEELDNLVGPGTEEAIYREAYKQGYDEGSEEGRLEGWTVGLNTGADIGSELGKYKGFALAVREHLQNKTGSDKASNAKPLKLCEKIINLVDQFDLENISSIHDATSQIRTQYNLLKTQCGVNDEQQSEDISGQKFSF